MREIKFRAHVEDDIIEGRPAETYQVSTLEWDDDVLKSAILFSPKTQTFHNLGAKWFKLEQYTGQKDKNGTEICEGDKIQRDREYTVIFLEGCFALVNTKTGFYLNRYPSKEYEVTGRS